MRISDWSSECALQISPPRSRLFSPYPPPTAPARPSREQGRQEEARQVAQRQGHSYDPLVLPPIHAAGQDRPSIPAHGHGEARARSEEHTSELQSLMRISYAVFCLKKKNKRNSITDVITTILTYF